MYYSPIYMYIHICLYCKQWRGNLGRPLYSLPLHYILYSFMWPPLAHLQNHDSVSFVSEHKQEEENRDLLEAAHAPCGLKKSHENFTE